jgi:NlpC/P60 family putative phage cell wall peptidase
VIERSREEIVSAARLWIGTPYHHQASRCGTGADCLGLVRGVYRDASGVEPVKPPPYNPAWAEISLKDDLLNAAQQYLVPRELAWGELAALKQNVLPGDILVFKMFPRSASKHCGIVSSPGKMIHAYDPHGTVETPLGDDWLRKVRGVFAYPFMKD